MRAVTTKSQMRLMLTSVLPNSTPATHTSRLAFSSSALVAPMEVPLLPLPNPPMCTRRLIRPRVLSDLNGEALLSSPLLLAPLLLPREPERTGLAASPTSIPLLNLLTLTSLVVSLSEEVPLLLCSDSRALSRSSRCASPTTISIDPDLRDEALLPLPRATNTRNLPLPLPNLSPQLPRLSAELPTPTGVELHRLHRLLPLAMLTAPTLLLMVWHLSDLQTALAQTVDWSTTTGCRLPSRRIPNIRHRLRCILTTRKCQLRELLRTDLLALLAPPDPPDLLDLLSLSPMFPCKGLTTDRLPSARRECESGRRSLWPRSKPTMRTVLVSTTCATDDHLLHPANPTAATHPKFDVLRTRAERKSSVALKSQDGLRSHRAIPVTTTILRMLPITLPAMRQDLTIFHRCSKVLPLYLEFLTSPRQSRPLRRSGRKAWSMLLLLARLLLLPSLRGQLEKWRLTKTTMIVERMRRRPGLSPTDPAPAPPLATQKHPPLSAPPSMEFPVLHQKLNNGWILCCLRVEEFLMCQIVYFFLYMYTTFGGLVSFVLSKTPKYCQSRGFGLSWLRCHQRTVSVSSPLP